MIEVMTEKKTPTAAISSGRAIKTQDACEAFKGSTRYETDAMACWRHRWKQGAKKEAFTVFL